MADQSSQEIGQAVGQALASAVDAEEVVGVACGIWRDGSTEVVTAGWLDRERGIPVERDTMFRIASLSKPITSVAALAMVEESLFGLDDPIGDWAPELMAMRVLRTPDGSLDDTEPAARPITFRDLLTHRSGLTYGSFHGEPLMHAYDAALGGEIDSAIEPDEWIARLATLPLVDQPGTRFRYGRSTDLLGLLLGRVDGSDLPTVLQRRVFDPLCMNDTCFVVERARRHRRALLYGPDDHGRLAHRLTAAGGSTVAERPEDMSFVSGGQGLWSTVDDYLRFARLFVEAGTVGSNHVIDEETLTLMTSNQLTDEQRVGAEMLGFPIFAGGHGFGLGVAVVTRPDLAPASLCRGGIGTVGWPGAFGSWWQADPTTSVALVLLTHHILEMEHIARGDSLVVHALREQFHEIASG